MDVLILQYLFKISAKTSTPPVDPPPKKVKATPIPTKAFPQRAANKMVNRGSIFSRVKPLSKLNH